MDDQTPMGGSLPPAPKKEMPKWLPWAVAGALALVLVAVVSSQGDSGSPSSGDVAVIDDAPACLDRTTSIAASEEAEENLNAGLDAIADLDIATAASRLEDVSDSIDEAATAMDADPAVSEPMHEAAEYYADAAFKMGNVQGFGASDISLIEGATADIEEATARVDEATDAVAVTTVPDC